MYLDQTSRNALRTSSIRWIINSFVVAIITPNCKRRTMRLAITWTIDSSHSRRHVAFERRQRERLIDEICHGEWPNHLDSRVVLIEQRRSSRTHQFITSIVQPVVCEVHRFSHRPTHPCCVMVLLKQQIHSHTHTHTNVSRIRTIWVPYICCSFVTVSRIRNKARTISLCRNAKDTAILRLTTALKIIWVELCKWRKREYTKNAHTTSPTIRLFWICERLHTAQDIQFIHLYYIIGFLIHTKVNSAVRRSANATSTLRTA